MPLSTTISVAVGATLTGSNDFGTPTHRVPFSFEDSLATGTGIDQADQIWVDQRTLTAGQEELIDLAGALTNGLGASVTFARIKLMLIENETTTATFKLAVGGATAAQFTNWVANATDIVNVGPGGMFMHYDPSAAASVVGTNDQLLINNANSASVTYNIILVGATV